MVTTTVSLGTVRSVPVHSFGVNGADVKTRINMWSDPNYLTTVQALAPNLIRYAGGTTANYWRYRTSKTDVSWGGYTTDGGKNSDGTPQTLTLQRFKDVCDAAGAVPVFDLNIACDAAVFGNSYNSYDCKPYGLPNITETLAFLNACADIGLPVTYLELGNELPSFNDPQVKQNYAFTLQANGKSDPVTGVPYTQSSFPAGMVWDWNALPLAPGTLNSNGQDEFYLSLGQAMTGFPEPADVPGLGGGGGGWLYGVRCSQWIKAIKTWATGRSLPTPKFMVCVANKPAGGSGPTSKKYWNQGLAHGLDASGAGVPDYFVLHPYWSTDISYTYGQPTPSIDPNSAGYTTTVEDAYLYAPMEGTATAQDGDVIWLPPGTDGSSGLQFYYSLLPLTDRGIRLANTEFGQLEQETIAPPPALSTGGVDSGHGGFGQILTQLTSVPYRLEVVPPLDIATIHCLSGNAYVNAAFTNGTGGFKPNTLYAYGFNTPRDVGTVTIAGNKATVSDGSLTSGDVHGHVKANGITGTILSVQSGTAATLSGSPGDTSGAGTVEQAVAHPQFRMAGAAFPLPGPPSISWNKSASGWSMLVLNRCTRGMDTFYPLAFSGGPTLADSGAGTAYRGLVGGYWTNSSSRKTAVITHLRRDTATLTLPAALVGLPAVILSAASLAVPITQQADFTTTQLTTASTVTLPPHSALYINSDFATPAALVADMADPSFTSTSSGGVAIQIATTNDLNAGVAAAESFATTQANAAKAASIPLTSLTGKGSIPVGTAPNTAGHLDLGATPDGYVLKASAAANTGLAWGANSMSGLSDASPSMGVYSGSGATIGSGSSFLTDNSGVVFTDAMSNRIVTITSGGASIGLPGCTFTTKYKASNQLTLTYVSGNGGVNPLPAPSFVSSIAYTVAMADQSVPVWDSTTGRWLGKSPGTNTSVVGMWQANTGYKAGQIVLHPTYYFPVSAKTAFISGATYDSTNWNFAGSSRVILQWTGTAWPARPAGLPNGLAEYVGPASATNPTDMTVGDTLVLGG